MGLFFLLLLPTFYAASLFLLIHLFPSLPIIINVFLAIPATFILLLWAEFTLLLRMVPFGYGL